jgi:hypothetical protein
MSSGHIISTVSADIQRTYGIGENPSGMVQHFTVSLLHEHHLPSGGEIVSMIMA